MTQLADKIAHAERLWGDFDNARLDIRFAEREGDADKIEAAKEEMTDIQARWHAAHISARAEARKLCAELGVTADALRSVLG